jgi:hypothetical protein
MHAIDELQYNVIGSGVINGARCSLLGYGSFVKCIRASGNEVAISISLLSLSFTTQSAHYTLLHTPKIRDFWESHEFTVYSTVWVHLHSWLHHK